MTLVRNSEEFLRDKNILTRKWITLGYSYPGTFFFFSFPFLLFPFPFFLGIANKINFRHSWLLSTHNFPSLLLCLFFLNVPLQPFLGSSSGIHCSLSTSGSTAMSSASMKSTCIDTFFNRALLFPPPQQPRPVHPLGDGSIRSLEDLRWKSCVCKDVHYCVCPPNKKWLSKVW